MKFKNGDKCTISGCDKVDDVWLFGCLIPNTSNAIVFSESGLTSRTVLSSRIKPQALTEEAKVEALAEVMYHDYLIGFRNGEGSNMELEWTQYANCGVQNGFRHVARKQLKAFEEINKTIKLVQETEKETRQREVKSEYNHEIFVTQLNNMIDCLRDNGELSINGRARLIKFLENLDYGKYFK